MKKNQVIAKYRRMKKELHAGIDKEVERLLNSGGIDPEKFENNFRLPKILLCAALHHQVFQYQPNTKEDRSDVTNLTHF